MLCFVARCRYNNCIFSQSHIGNCFPLWSPRYTHKPPVDLESHFLLRKVLSTLWYDVVLYHTIILIATLIWINENISFH